MSLVQTYRWNLSGLLCLVLGQTRQNPDVRHGSVTCDYGNIGTQLLSPTMIPNHLDRKLWEKARTSAIDTEPVSWFFDHTLFNITVADLTGIMTYQLGPRAFKELAIFDIMATFWESLPPAGKEKQIVTLVLYHKLLRQAVTQELHSQLQPTKSTSGGPSILQAWLERTLCLLGHEYGDKKLLREFNYPSCLIDNSMFNEFFQDELILQFTCSL